MLTTEFISALGALIREFGFPIFVALCGLLFFWQMFAYMKATVTKKDCDFLNYINSSNKQLADYVQNRDMQINSIVDKHNVAFVENSHALNRLSDSVELRINDSIRKRQQKQSLESDGTTLA